jgi:hypothetical protein
LNRNASSRRESVRADVDQTHLHDQVMEAGVIQRATGSGAPLRRSSIAKTWLKAIEHLAD